MSSSSSSSRWNALKPTHHAEGNQDSPDDDRQKWKSQGQRHMQKRHDHRYDSNESNIQIERRRRQRQSQSFQSRVGHDKYDDINSARDKHNLQNEESAEDQIRQNSSSFLRSKLETRMRHRPGGVQLVSTRTEKESKTDTTLQLQTKRLTSEMRTNTDDTTQLSLESIQKRLDQIFMTDAECYDDCIDDRGHQQQQKQYCSVSSLTSYYEDSIKDIEASICRRTDDQTINLMKNLVQRYKQVRLDVIRASSSDSQNRQRQNQDILTTAMIKMMALTRILACVVSKNVDKLTDAAEETAQIVVNDIFVPFLGGHYDDINHDVLILQIRNNSNDEVNDIADRRDPRGWYRYMKFFIGTLHSISETMKCLLFVGKNKSQSHCNHVITSAILAPLVQDVTVSDGEEVLVINPLRIRILQELSSGLVLRLADDHENQFYDQRRRDEAYPCISKHQSHSHLFQLERLTMFCELLSVTLDAIRKIDDPGESSIKRHAQQRMQLSSVNCNKMLNLSGLNLIKVQQFVLKILGDEESVDQMIQAQRPSCVEDLGRRNEKRLRQRLYISTLRILKELIVIYPASMTRVGWKLLIETTDETETTPVSSLDVDVIGNGKERCMCDFYCQRTTETLRPMKSYRYLLRVVHSFSDSESNDAEEVCLSLECLTCFFESLPWRIWLGNQTNKQAGGKAIQQQSSGIARRVVESLESITRILHCTFHRWTEQCQRKDDRVSRAWTSLITVFFRVVPFEDDTNLNQAAQCIWASIASRTRHSSKSICTDVVLSCLGGSVTPNGVLQGPVIPARSWLLDTKAGNQFVSNIIREVRADQFVQVRDEHVILQAILRSLPNIVILHWDAFDCLLKTLKAGRELNGNLISLRLLNALSKGRKDFGIEVVSQSDIRHKFLGLVRVMVVDDTRLLNVQQQRLTLDILANLDGQDWDWLDCHEHSEMFQYLNMMLDCTKSSNAGIREDSCNAIGQFCATYKSFDGLLASNNDEKSTLCIEISNSMLYLLDDKKTSVRSIAFHVVGNLAFALRESCCTDMVNGHLIELCRKTLRSIKDSDMKVRGNAIRSLGHLGFLVARNYHTLGAPVIPLLGEIVLGLTATLRDSVAVMISIDSYLSFTSKQRSFARKHGWGACNSLGHVFRAYQDLEKHGDADDDDCALVRSAVSSSFRACVECLSHHKTINDKVVQSAIQAMISLDPRVIDRIDSTTGMIGDALISSLHALLEMKKDRSVNTTNEKLRDANDALVVHLLEHSSIADIVYLVKSEQLNDQCFRELYAWMVEQENISAGTFGKFSAAFQQMDEERNNRVHAVDALLEHLFVSRASMLRTEVSRSSEGLAEKGIDDELHDDEDEL